MANLDATAMVQADGICLMAVERVNGVASLGQRREEVLGNRPAGPLDLTRINAKLFDDDIVKTLGELPNSRISPSSDFVDDRPNVGHWSLSAKIGTGQVQGIAWSAIAQIEDVHHGPASVANRQSRIGKDREMPADRSELSSLADMLEQLTRRITDMAESAERNKEEGVAKELYAIERGLSGAHRRVVRLLGSRG